MYKLSIFRHVRLGLSSGSNTVQWQSLVVIFCVFDVNIEFLFLSLSREQVIDKPL